MAVLTQAGMAVSWLWLRVNLVRLVMTGRRGNAVICKIMMKIAFGHYS